MTSADPKRALPPILPITTLTTATPADPKRAPPPPPMVSYTHPMDCTNTRTKSGANPAPGR